ncbi:hypothetical protein P8T57_01255 [Thalassospira sp. SN3W]|uniref:hypothetical protein n=1 Tax=Thalassospira sp. SN3W TaxID=3035476 RepID=UPI00311B3207
MRFVSRGKTPAPSELKSRNKDGKTEFERAQAHMAAPIPPGQKRAPFNFRVYKSDEVKQRLEKLFHGKCAYCETFYASHSPVDIEHYRPKGAVEGDTNHPGYWWLAMAWDNLLPSCIDCNRRRKQSIQTVTNDLMTLQRTILAGKKDCFPIAGSRAQTVNEDLAKEQALLLDPTREDPTTHLQFSIQEGPSSGLVFPRSQSNSSLPPPVPQDAIEAPNAARKSNVSVKGAVSIQVLGLNRLHLVQERAQVLQRLRFFEYIIVRIGTAIQKLSQPHLTVYGEVGEAILTLRHLQRRIIQEMGSLAKPEAPYSELAKSYIDDFKSRLK